MPQRLRKILYPELTDHEVETIVVCLMAHLLIENSLNGLLYRWLKQDTTMIRIATVMEKVYDNLWKNIVKLDFAKKYCLVEPFLSVCFSKEDVAGPWEINDLRNNIFHGRTIKDATFRGRPIGDERTVEDIFLVAQQICMNFDKLVEMLDAPHALADRWRGRLEELNEPIV